MKAMSKFLFYLVKVVFEAVVLGIVLAYILKEVLNIAG